MIRFRIKTRRIENSDGDPGEVYRWVARHGKIQAAGSTQEIAATRLLSFMVEAGKLVGIHEGQPGRLETKP